MQDFKSKVQQDIRLSKQPILIDNYLCELKKNAEKELDQPKVAMLEEEEMHLKKKKKKKGRKGRGEMYETEMEPYQEDLDTKNKKMVEQQSKDLLVQSMDLDQLLQYINETDNKNQKQQ